MEVATLGGGCFWCLEAVYLDLEGVHEVLSGYSGGASPHPSYEEVCTGTTGHAEVVQVHFDPDITTFSEILEVFFSVHDPTTLNRQGADVGTQYRSVIFYHSPDQREAAEGVIEVLNRQEIWSGPIVTEVTALHEFFPAGDYHSEYYRRNQNQPYCQAVIDPKVSKFRSRFAHKLKSNQD